MDDVAPIVIPENPPWLNPKPTFNFELTQYKKSETNPLLIQQHFAEIRSVTSEYSTIYTDGSKDGDRVAVFRQQVYSARLPSASSIFSAEANAILLALKFVASSENIGKLLSVLPSKYKMACYFSLPTSIRRE